MVAAGEARSGLRNAEARSIAVNAKLHFAGTASDGGIGVSGTAVEEPANILERRFGWLGLLCAKFTKSNQKGVVNGATMEQNDAENALNTSRVGQTPDGPLPRLRCGSSSRFDRLPSSRTRT